MFLWNFNQRWRTGSTITLYWIPKIHERPFKQRYIAGSAKFSTKPLSKLLTCILLAVKTELQSYTGYSKGGVNQMWILKNSKDLLEYMHSRSLSPCNSIKTFDFSTLHTNIPMYLLSYHHFISRLKLSSKVLTWSVVDCRFESHRFQTKDYDVGICFLSIKNVQMYHQGLRARTTWLRANCLPIVSVT